MNIGKGIILDQLTGESIPIDAFADRMQTEHEYKRELQNLRALDNQFLELERRETRVTDIRERKQIEQEKSQVARERMKSQEKIAGIQAAARTAPKTLNVTGTPGYSKEGATVAKTRADIRQISSSVQNYRKLLDNFNPRSLREQLDPQKIAELSTAYHELLIRAKDLFTLGALTGPDLGLIQNTITDPNSIKGGYFGKEGLLKQLDQVTGIIERGMKAYEEQFGATRTPIQTPPRERSLDDIKNKYRR